MDILVPLTKVDQARRLVSGRACASVPDRSGEIMDWETGKVAIQDWSNSFVQATNGLSKGNVRVMHDPKKVAGKVVEISFDDDAKAVDVVCKVVDDQEWRKVEEGVYTGFSIGGGYASRWRDDATGLTKYTPRLAEISLVDRPCIPGCHIVELHKADGVIEELRMPAIVAAAPRTFSQIPPAPRTFAALSKGWFSRTKPEGELPDGDHSLWDEEDHPRDAQGRFTAKAKAMGVGKGVKDKGVSASVLENLMGEDLDKLIAKSKKWKESKAVREEFDGDIDMNLIYGNGSIAANLISEVRSGKEDPVTALKIWHNWVRGAKVTTKDGYMRGLQNFEDDMDENDKPRKGVKVAKADGCPSLMARLILEKAADNEEQPRWHRIAGAVGGGLIGNRLGQIAATPFALRAVKHTLNGRGKRAIAAGLGAMATSWGGTIGGAFAGHRMMDLRRKKSA